MADKHSKEATKAKGTAKVTAAKATGSEKPPAGGKAEKAKGATRKK